VNVGRSINQVSENGCRDSQAAAIEVRFPADARQYFVAGIRQHYLPRFLQRPFVNETGFTWLFRKNQPGVTVSTANVGLEKSFYTETDNTTVDDAITAEEKEFSRTTNRLHSSPRGKTNSSGIPRLLAHLEVRSRHIRQNFLQSTTSLYEKTIPVLNDTQRFGGLLSAHIKNDPTNLVEMVRDSLRDNGRSESEAAAIASAIEQSLPDLLERMAPELQTAAAGILQNLPETLRRAVKGAHIQALQKTIAPDVRAQWYEQLTFEIAEVSTNDMILGDSAVLFQVDGPKQFKPAAEKGDVIVAAFLPLAPDRVLIGTHQPYYFDSSELRRAIARCSLEFFIASADSDENAALAEAIGTDATMLSESDMQRIADEALTSE